MNLCNLAKRFLIITKFENRKDWKQGDRNRVRRGIVAARFIGLFSNLKPPFLGKVQNPKSPPHLNPPSRWGRGRCFDRLSMTASMLICAHRCPSVDSTLCGMVFASGRARIKTTIFRRYRNARFQPDPPVFFNPGPRARKDHQASSVRAGEIPFPDAGHAAKNAFRMDRGRYLQRNR